MLFLSPPGQVVDFDTGLVPGVLIGAFVAAFFSGEVKIEGFKGGHAMRRYLIGAVFMGFGGMLAGGCSVASVSGSAVFATTSWLTLFAIWIGAMATDRLVDSGIETGTAKPIDSDRSSLITTERKRNDL